MRRYIIILLAALVALCAMGCDQAANGDTVVDAMTVPEIGESEADPEQTMESQDAIAAAARIAEVSVEPVETPNPVFETTAEGDLTVIETATPGPAESFAYTDEDQITVQYYDMETEQEQQVQYPVTDATDPLAVVDGVTAALHDVLDGQHIKVSSTNYSDGNLFIDFDRSIYDLGMSSGEENQVLNSIADTYLSNVEGIKAVYYTVDGATYQSEHTQLAPGEAYKTSAD